MTVDDHADQERDDAASSSAQPQYGNRTSRAARIRKPPTTMNNVATNNVSVTAEASGFSVIMKPTTRYSRPARICTSTPLHWPAQNAVTMVAMPAIIRNGPQDHHGGQRAEHGQCRENYRGGAADRQQNTKQKQPPPLRPEVLEIALQLLALGGARNFRDALARFDAHGFCSFTELETWKHVNSMRLCRGDR